eukprot:CAMPEP_0202907820 /NCGR_PEP_ID=MMETSP1392-20130828/43968_1 /ASSEMBLY_ACC=CAM_ASM_000868 /TAXON_ID=225041 /ORGANISM="Chlamydomonas chlamydogama, Strain SAG 11-48b" /LENGTH=79 /DNA_ID=CAMNT_0049596885 /DNA_START=39 /DNA_END=275 /DNA_ORIENTATION=+
MRANGCENARRVLRPSNFSSLLHTGRRMDLDRRASRAATHTRETSSLAFIARLREMLDNWGSCDMGRVGQALRCIPASA